MLESLNNKVYYKESPAHVFSCEYCEIFKNSFFYRTPPVAASRDIQASYITPKRKFYFVLCFHFRLKREKQTLYLLHQSETYADRKS